MRSGNTKCSEEGDQPPKSSYLPSEENGKNANANVIPPYGLVVCSTSSPSIFSSRIVDTALCMDMIGVVEYRTQNEYTYSLR